MQSTCGVTVSVYVDSSLGHLLSHDEEGSNKLVVFTQINHPCTSYSFIGQNTSGEN
jgi:hypothetical protein